MLMIIAIGGHTHFSIDPLPEIIDGLGYCSWSSLRTALMIKCRDKKENDLVMVRKVLIRRKSYGFEYRTPGSFLLSPSVTLVHFTFSKLTVVGVLEDKVDFNELKNRQHTLHIS